MNLWTRSVRASVGSVAALGCVVACGSTTAAPTGATVGTTTPIASQAPVTAVVGALRLTSGSADPVLDGGSATIDVAATCDGGNSMIMIPCDLSSATLVLRGRGSRPMTVDAAHARAVVTSADATGQEIGYRVEAITADGRRATLPDSPGQWQTIDAAPKSQRTIPLDLASTRATFELVATFPWGSATNEVGRSVPDAAGGGGVTVGPSAATITSDGTVLVADSVNARVIISKSGKTHVIAHKVSAGTVTMRGAPARSGAYIAADGGLVRYDTSSDSLTDIIGRGTSPTIALAGAIGSKVYAKATSTLEVDDSPAGSAVPKPATAPSPAIPYRLDLASRTLFVDWRGKGVTFSLPSDQPVADVQVWSAESVGNDLVVVASISLSRTFGLAVLRVSASGQSDIQWMEATPFDWGDAHVPIEIQPDGTVVAMVGSADGLKVYRNSPKGA